MKKLLLSLIIAGGWNVALSAMDTPVDQPEQESASEEQTPRFIIEIDKEEDNWVPQREHTIEAFKNMLNNGTIDDIVWHLKKNKKIQQFHLDFAFSTAAKNSDYKIASLLYNEGANAFVPLEGEDSALSHAIKHKNAELLTLCINWYTRNKNLKEIFNTIFEDECPKNQGIFEKTKNVLNEHNRIFKQFYKDYRFLVAVKNNSYEIASQLYNQGANAFISFEGEDSALSHAIKHKNEQLVKLCVDWYACNEKLEEITTKIFLKRISSKNKDILQFYKDYSFFIAVKNNNCEIASQLYNQGANAFISLEEEDSALSHAIKHKNAELVKLCVAWYEHNEKLEEIGIDLILCGARTKNKAIYTEMSRVLQTQKLIKQERIKREKEANATPQEQRHSLQKPSKKSINCTE